MAKRKSVDIPFLLTLCALVAFGLIIFTSAALGLLARDGASFSSVAFSQLLLGLTLGSLACFILAKIDYRLWRPYTPYFFAFAIALTLLTFVPGVGLELKGASRWIRLGPITFQPEEVLKFAAVLFLAALYAVNFRKMATYRAALVPFFGIVGLSSFILILQPNTDSIAIIGMAALGMLYAAGGKLKHIFLIVLLGVVAVAGAAYTYPHVANRIHTYLDQSADPQGAGWQIQQSLIAVGSGGVWGRGLGQGVEKFSYLPEPIGDSIFAVAAEEFGFVGSAFLVFLFTLFALLGLRIAARAPDPFGGLLVVGLVILIVGQSFFNMASTLGLIPLAGLPLIFVSHGGTALMLALAECGVILSVSRHMRAPKS